MFESLNFSFDFLWDRNARKLDQQFDDWLYGDWNEQKYEDYKLLTLVPFLSDYMDYRLDLRSDAEYLNRYGMDYTDIHDPRKLKQSSSYSGSIAGASVRMISKNIDRLYR